MAYYEVDLNALSKVVGMIDTSTQAFETGLNELGFAIYSLNANWSGVDANEFGKSYDGGSESTKETGKKMVNEILEYRAYFNKALKWYLEVQDEAKKYAEKITDN